MSKKKMSHKNNDHDNKPGCDTPPKGHHDNDHHNNGHHNNGHHNNGHHNNGHHDNDHHGGGHHNPTPPVCEPHNPPPPPPVCEPTPPPPPPVCEPHNPPPPPPVCEPTPPPPPPVCEPTPPPPPPACEPTPPPADCGCHTPDIPLTFMLGSQTEAATTGSFASLWGQSGFTISTVALSSSTVAGPTVTTEVNSSNFSTLLALQAGGIGVAGNTTPGSSSPNGETGYDPVTHQSEGLIINFAHDVQTAKFGLSYFYNAASNIDQGKNEAMQIQLYDGGVLVGTSEIVANGTTSNSHFTAVDNGSGSVSVTVNGITFDKVVLTGLAYDNPSTSAPDTNGQGSIVADSSDFSLQYVSGTFADCSTSSSGGLGHAPPTNYSASNTHHGLNHVSYNLLQGDGNDLLIGGDFTVTNELRAANYGCDVMYGGDGDCTRNYMIGGSHATNQMYGGDDGATNFMYGGGGNQQMFGGDHATNNIWGGGGVDKIIGGDYSTNTIYGGTGNVTITGGDHATNVIYTETGNDIVHGGNSSVNTIYGGPAPSQLFGGDCSCNTIYGGGGDVTITGGFNSTNLIYGGGGNAIIVGGDYSHNTFYAEWGDHVTITGGNHSYNTFYDGGGNDTYIGGLGDNLFVFNDLKYPLLSQGIQGNKVYPVALADQSVTSGFQFISDGHDTVHGNAASANNIIGLKGAASTWTITITDPGSAVHNADGSWTAATGQTLHGTITSSVNHEVVTFDHVNQVKFIA
ncbi:MAG: calcium-binding protein [Alphaproteobacteria bacterium]|nr:calcium-binding protein [Alphaproteobacteria bacterium]